MSTAQLEEVPDGYLSFGEVARVLFGSTAKAHLVAKTVLHDMARPDREQKWPRVTVRGLTYVKIPEGISANQVAEDADPARVYFIRGGGFVKIGVADDVKARLAAIQTSCPYECEIALVEVGGYSREKELHRRFKEYRARGEWFRYEGRLAAYIEAGAGHPIPTKGRRKK